MSPILLKKSLINFIMVQGKKQCSEKIIKQVVKKLLKNNTKSVKNLVYIKINQFLLGFYKTEKVVKVRKEKSFKFTPYFLANKQRALVGLKILLAISNKQTNFNRFTDKLFIAFLLPDLFFNKLELYKKLQYRKAVLLFYRF